jgi:hypothetical protein
MPQGSLARCPDQEKTDLCRQDMGLKAHQPAHHHLLQRQVLQPQQLQNLSRH